MGREAAHEQPDKGIGLAERRHLDVFTRPTKGGCGAVAGGCRDGATRMSAAGALRDRREYHPKIRERDEDGQPGRLQPPSARRAAGGGGSGRGT